VGTQNVTNKKFSDIDVKQMILIGMPTEIEERMFVLELEMKPMVPVTRLFGHGLMVPEFTVK
jgi:hypothetical protein